MTANSPSEDPSLPPRHRLSLEKLRKEATESDLWNLDDEAQPAAPAYSPRQHRPVDIVSDDLEPTVLDSDTHAASYDHSEEDHTANYETEDSQQPYVEEDFSEPNETRRSPLDDIGELDGIEGWDDDEIPMPTIQSAIERRSDTNIDSAENLTNPSVSPESIAQPVAPNTTENQRKSSITRNEIVAIASVAVGIIIVAGYFLVNALSGLPRIKDPYEKPNLPIAGNHFSVNKVESYWRVPVVTGPDADTVQRGTELIPVLEITATGEDAALRIQFRNSDGAAVGDPITHTVSGNTSLVIPSTAGLEDINTHNAYRTNLIEPWTAEILEAAAGTTSGSAFRSLITVPISPDRR